MPHIQPPKFYRPSKKVQAAMDAAYAARQAELAARTARDAATPVWLKALRHYIDEAIQHHLAEQYVGEDGHSCSDMAGQEKCEELWTEVVEGLPTKPLLTPLSPQAQIARQPMPSESLIGALQDRVHTDTGKVRVPCVAQEQARQEDEKNV